MSSAVTIEVTSLATLQMGCSRDSSNVHLVRSTSNGTPGPTLCGIDRFARGAPGWSVRGGVDGPDMVHQPCEGCIDVARAEFFGLPVSGMRRLAEPLTRALATA